MTPTSGFWGKNFLKIIWLALNFLTIPKYVRGSLVSIGGIDNFWHNPWKKFFDFCLINWNFEIKIAKKVRKWSRWNSGTWWSTKFTVVCNRLQSFSKKNIMLSKFFDQIEQKIWSKNDKILLKPFFCVIYIKNLQKLLISKVLSFLIHQIDRKSNSRPSKMILAEFPDFVGGAECWGSNLFFFWLRFSVISRSSICVALFMIFLIIIYFASYLE